MSVKSRISNKTYTTSLELLEPEDRDVDSELYQITLSDRDFLIAPGKNRMEDGIAYGYAYAIRQNKVACKLGVYEKKTDKMPLIFDLSMFPEGSMCLFDEYSKNPSLLMGLEMSNIQTIFDTLIPLYAKLPDKTKQLKQAYRQLLDLYNKEKDKEMKPILAAISAASKKEDTDLLTQLQERLADPKTSGTRQFVQIMLALQFVFQIEFQLRTEEPELLEIINRWKIEKPTRTIEVDVYTQQMIQERPYLLSQSAPGISVPDVSQDVSREVSQDVPEETSGPALPPLPPIPESKSLFAMAGPPDPYQDVLPDKPEPRPEPVRKRATKPKAPAQETQEKVEVPVLDIKRKPRVGTSLNDVTLKASVPEPEVKPVKPKTIREGLISM
jgi:hypothetical protein